MSGLTAPCESSSSPAEAASFLDKVADLLVGLIPAYAREGKSYLTVALGCTGGRHRSVVLPRSSPGDWSCPAPPRRSFTGTSSDDARRQRGAGRGRAARTFGGRRRSAGGRSRWRSWSGSGAPRRAPVHLSRLRSGLGRRRRGLVGTAPRGPRRRGARGPPQMPGGPGRAGLPPGRRIRAPLRRWRRPVGPCAREPRSRRALGGRRRPRCRHRRGGFPGRGPGSGHPGDHRAGGPAGPGGRGGGRGTGRGLQGGSDHPGGSPSLRRHGSPCRRRRDPLGGPGGPRPRLSLHEHPGGGHRALDCRRAGKTRAQRVYVCNLRPQIPETEGYDVAAHVAALHEHGVEVDVVLCDTACGMPLGRLELPVVDRPVAGPTAWCTIRQDWRRRSLNLLM